MNKYDKRVKELLNEIVGALGAAYRAAQDPAKELSSQIKGFQQNLEKNKSDKEKISQQSLSVENPPKTGQIVVAKSQILGTSKKEKNPNYEPDILKRKPKASPKEIEDASREFLPTKMGVIVPQATIFGKITKNIDTNTGFFGVALTDENGKPTQKYVFAQTESQPYWQVYDATKLPDDDVLVDEKGILMKLTSIMTGLTKNDVVDSLKNWYDYNTYIKSKK